MRARVSVRVSSLRLASACARMRRHCSPASCTAAISPSGPLIASSSPISPVISAISRELSERSDRGSERRDIGVISPISRVISPESPLVSLSALRDSWPLRSACTWSRLGVGLGIGVGLRVGLGVGVGLELGLGLGVGVGVVRLGCRLRLDDALREHLLVHAVHLGQG